MKYDIAHLEDDFRIVLLFRLNAKKAEISYKSLKSLEDLENFLKSGDRGRVYFVDGNFPRQSSSAKVEFLAEDAILTIRENHKDAKITLCSSDGLAKGIADKLNVRYVNKADIYLASEIEKIKAGTA